MAAESDQIMAMVEAELTKNPDVTTDELFQKAREQFPTVGSLTIRQFHGRYPLQVKRRRASKAATPKAAKAEGGRKRGRPAAAASAKSAKPRGKRGAPARAKAAAPAAAAPPAAAPSAGAAGRGGRRASRAASPQTGGGAAVDREAIRATLLAFAGDIVAASDDKVALVKVLGGLDRYVDRLEKNASR